MGRVLVGSNPGRAGESAGEHPTDRLARRWPRILLRVALLILFLWVCLDLFNATILGGLFAIVLHPWHVKLRHRIPRLSPLLLTIAAVLLVILPLAFAVTQAMLTASEMLGGDPKEAISNAQDQAVNKLAQIAREYNISAGSARDFAADVGRRVGNAAGALLGMMAKGLPSFLIDLFIFVVSLFYFIRDGDRLTEWLKETVPFERVQTGELFGAINDTVRGAILGTIAVAVVQGALTLIALLSLGVPGAFLWAMVAAFFSLVPVFGTAPVTISAAIYLFSSGEPVKGGIMVAAAFLIGFSDNIVRPWVQSSRGHMHPLLALLSIFGGINVFGPFGIFIGPVVAAMAIWAIESYRNRKVPRIDVSQISHIETEPSK